VDFVNHRCPKKSGNVPKMSMIRKQYKKYGTDVNNGRKFDFLYNLPPEESNKVP
jgi:hypothetical protein